MRSLEAFQDSILFLGRWATAARLQRLSWSFELESDADVEFGLLPLTVLGFSVFAAS